MTSWIIESVAIYSSKTIVENLFRLFMFIFLILGSVVAAIRLIKSATIKVKELSGSKIRTDSAIGGILVALCILITFVVAVLGIIVEILALRQIPLGGNVLKEQVEKVLVESANRSAAANFLYLFVCLCAGFIGVIFAIGFVYYAKKRYRERRWRKIKPAEIVLFVLGGGLILLEFAIVCVVIASICIAIRQAL